MIGVTENISHSTTKMSQNNMHVVHLWSASGTDSNSSADHVREYISNGCL
jgi:hypothetical protein